MTLDIAVVFGILLFAVILFVTEWVRIDVVALMVLVALALTGILTPEQAVAGFSNPAVITIWAVFILSGGLARTGVAGILGRQVLRVAGSSERRLVMVIMLTSASLSAFMNNVGVAALLLPVVMDISRRTRVPPSKLLIPLAFSSLLGGLLTLIGTPPNILVSAALEERGLEPFGLFDFTPVGAGIVVAGIVYMGFFGRGLLPSRDPAREMAEGEGGEVDLDAVYGLSDRLYALEITEGSSLAGKSIAESRLGSALGLRVMGVQRGGDLELAPDPTHVLRAGDQIVAQGPRETAEELGAHEYLSLESDSVELEQLVSPDVGFAEIRLAEGSELAGQTLSEIDFRHRFHGCLVLAVWRDGASLRTHLGSTPLNQGDVLLVHGRRDELDRVGRDRDFVVSDIFDPLVYDLEKRLMRCRVPAGSPLVGKTLAESRLGDVFSLGVMGIIRAGEKRLIPAPDERLEAGDELLVKGRPEDLVSVETLHGMPVSTRDVPGLEDLESEEVGLAELVLSPRSSAAGRTLSQINFREKYGLNVLAVMREGTVERNLRYLVLRFGDGLLLHGPRAKLRLLRSEPDFIVLSGAAEEPPVTRKAPLSALLMLGVVLAVLVGLLPIHIAAMTGALAMVLTRCLTMDEAYRAIEWKAVFLIAGMLPLGAALQQTGAADLLAAGVVKSLGALGPRAVVAGLYALASVCAQVMPTAAVAILVAPMAVTTAAELGLSPYALMMTVAMSASASFMSPVAHPSNVLIMGPGGYRFVDYIKVGLPLTIVCLIVTVLLLPLFFPLVP